MKINIRKGCFETNSSSMHSIVVMNDEAYYSTEEIMENIFLMNNKDTKEKECVLRPYDNDLIFGRSPFRAIGDFIDKWMYCLASLVKEYNDDIYKELKEIAMKYIPGLKYIELPVTTELIDKEKYKTEEELDKYLDDLSKKIDYPINEYWDSTSGKYWAVDVPFTGSTDGNNLSGFLKENNISLEEFITNKKYVIIQDGDEYCYYNDMKKYGLINEDKIDKECRI